MRTLILLDGGRLAYATDGVRHEELAQQLADAQKAEPSVYVFDADEIIDHRSDPEPEIRALTAEEAAGALSVLGKGPITLGGDEVEITSPLEAAWEGALEDLPDDGIAAWSLNAATDGGHLGGGGLAERYDHHAGIGRDGPERAEGAHRPGTAPGPARAAGRMRPMGDPTRAQLEHAITWIEGYLSRDASRPWYLGREQREIVRHWLGGRPFVSSAPRGSGRQKLARAVQAYHEQLETKPSRARPR